jgi:hypothetical protein
MPDSESLDLILKTRLEVLAQAVEEVNCVITAMEEQGERLAEVEEFLSDAGAMRQAENSLLEHFGDVKSRLEVLLRPPTLSAPAVARPGVRRPLPLPLPLSQPDRQRLHYVQSGAEKATQQILELAKCRAKALSAFQDVWRWSVAGLGAAALQKAVEDYQYLIRQIRTDENPWRRYQAEMPRLGHELFSRYLELLAGMAVRGLPMDSTVQSDADALIDLLKGPLDTPAEPLPSPLALMSSLGRRHTPLGYPEWSLWALPLMGRVAGERVAASLLPRDTGNRLHVICADLYAQYVLGPSYLHAAIFLEFDPSPDPPPNLPSDPLRATVLLRDLREYGATASRVIEGIAVPLEREWRRARTAFGGQEPDLDSADRQVVDDFLKELRGFVEIGYPVNTLGDLADDGRQLTAAGQDGSEPAMRPMQLRNLLSAMWFARLQDPSKDRLIHQRAKMVPRQQQRVSPSRAGFGAQPWSGTWA